MLKAVGCIVICPTWTERFVAVAIAIAIAIDIAIVVANWHWILCSVLWKRALVVRCKRFKLLSLVVPKSAKQQQQQIWFDCCKIQLIDCVLRPPIDLVAAKNLSFQTRFFVFFDRCNLLINDFRAVGIQIFVVINTHSKSLSYAT